MAFLRRISGRYPKLGKGRRKKQIWRKPKGRDNKMREKRRGYPVVVSIGYRKSKNEKQKTVIVRNVKKLEGVGKDNKIIIGKVGKKKRMEIAKKAKEMKIHVQNLNIEKFLKKPDKKEHPKIVVPEKKNESK